MSVGKGTIPLFLDRTGGNVRRVYFGCLTCYLFYELFFYYSYFLFIDGVETRTVKLLIGGKNQFLNMNL